MTTTKTTSNPTKITKKTINKSRSKLTAEHKKYLKTLITKTPTLKNTTLRDKLLTKFDDIDSIDPTTIGRFLKNDLGLKKGRYLMSEKEIQYMKTHGKLPK